MKSISIIGAGFSGSLTAVHLLSQENVKCKVTLYDPSTHAGRGVAYGVESEAFLLNVTASAMSAYPDEPEHFINWLKQKKLPFLDTDFVPRKIYGDYIQEILTLAGTASGRLEFKNNLVTKIEKHGQSWTVICDNGERQFADAIVLALGYARQDFEYLNPHLSSSYVGLGNCKKIAVIGSGLTAVDVIEECRAIGYKGDITLLSRSGKFPYVHKAIQSEHDALNFFSLLTLPKVKLSQIVKCLRTDIVRYGVDTVMHELRPYTVNLWNMLSLQDKQRFFRHTDSRWNRIRHRMPQSSADSIEALKNDGRLSIIRGQFKECQSKPDSRLKVIYNDTNGQNSFEVDKVFDCRGPSTSPKSQALIRDMLDQGLIQLGDLGRGLLTESNGRVATPNLPELFVIGPLRREALLETTAVKELRQQAAEVSAALILSLYQGSIALFLIFVLML